MIATGFYNLVAFLIFWILMMNINSTESPLLWYNCLVLVSDCRSGKNLYTGDTKCSSYLELEQGYLEVAFVSTSQISHWRGLVL